jgi:hypothetical protein
MFGLVLVPFCLRGQLDSTGAVDLMRRLERPSAANRNHLPKGSGTGIFSTGYTV